MLSTLLPLAIYFSCLAYLGFLGFRKTKNFSDYVLGGRKLGAVVGALNVGASDMSSWLLMGLPGAFYLYGLNQIWMVLGLIVGSYASWKIVAARLRQYSESAGNALTLSSFLENRFDDKSGLLSIVTSLTIIFFFTIYIASGFVGGAKLFAEVFAIPYSYALLISCVLIIFYALLGGFLAVSWADVLQGMLMLAVLLITPLYAIYLSPFSAADFATKMREISPAHLSPFRDLTLASLLGCFAWGLGYFGQPHIISKYMAIKNSREISLARKICISWMSLSMLGAAAVGLLGFVYFANQPLKEPETVFISMATQIFHPVMIGILIAAILAAIMSTLNSQIIICCSSLAKDFYQRFFRKGASEKEMLLVSRSGVVLIAMISCLLALDEKSSVLQLVAHAWAGLGASIGPVILFSLFYQKTTKLAAIVGIISGAVGAILFSKFPIFSYEILPAFLLSSGLIWVISQIKRCQTL
ncbi:MAG: sodium/proline symporter PutP [Alphaproteobacteria bacterium]|nr:sodium/proline symporter PutP [Alphaproteobacteria bacterium]